MEKKFNFQEYCKSHLEEFFTKKVKNLGRWIYEVVWKMAEGLREKKVNTLFNKVIGENKKNVPFIFT